jgi:FkbM family methyltransferase
MLAARDAGPSGRVVAFEPNPGNAAMIRKNACRNALSVEVVVAAVANEDGWAAFDDSSSLGGHLTRAGSVAVATISLDSCLGRFGEPSMVKLDIEGGEVNALEGASRLLADVRPAVLCECHATNAAVDRALTRHDYDVSVIEMPDIAPADAPWWVHLLAIPR